jgi:hypothetical protein
MKKIIILFAFIPCFAFSQGHEKIDSVRILKDSIVILNQRSVMTAKQFIMLYKYERLEKYYRICKKKPSQWKFYKGWTIRVFEQ